MIDLREEAQRQLEEVRRDFEARLGDMIEEVAQAWEIAKTVTEPTVPINRVLDLAHRLAGNAGFFGLRQVASRASELEQACERARDTGNTADCVEPINRLLELSPPRGRS